ncbi:MAG: LysR family transcriptional regulator [Mycolicibacterium sp.]|uniref:LysR family transcriptional regulator n=1 Tax=Mycolicibacterium sp. TaxID=2320850 RepID=UPI003D0A9502
MLIRQLEYFVAVARERHFGRAADACYVSQPALSTALAKLERELDLTLINRGQNFEGLTTEGERLAIWAKRLLADHDGLKAEAAALRSGLTGTLRIGTGPTVSVPVIGLGATFCKSHPRAGVKVSTRLSATELIDRLRTFELDGAISHFDRDDVVGLDPVPLYTEHLVLLVSGRKLASGRRSITWAEAAELPLILLTSDMQFRQVIDKAFAECGACPQPQVETDSMALIFSHVATGEWASVVPHTWLSYMPATSPARAIRLVKPELTTEIVIVTNPAAPDPVMGTTLLAIAASRQYAERFASYAHRDFSTV